MYNAQGDVVGLADSSGKVVVEYTYDAWGNPLSITGTLASTLGQFNPLRYRGYVWDNETGLYYVNSRYYNPETSRYINGDDRLLTQEMTGYNLFAYCNNNPVNLSDPTGHCPCEWVSRCTCPENPHYRKKLIQVDKKNFDWNNTDEQKVLDA